jgi:regulator of ribosome biosynthesis
MVEAEMADLAIASPEVTMADDTTTNGHSSVTVSKPIPYTFDLGNLLCNDSNPLPYDHDNATIDAAARDCAQALINQILSTCAITSTTEGVSIALPTPQTPLPREKSIPKAKDPTKWELFAKKKGIVSKKDGNKVYDEESGEWVNKRGYHGANKKDEETWLVEVDGDKEKRTGEAGDKRKEARGERKERIQRQARRERANERKAQK